MKKLFLFFILSVLFIYGINLSAFCITVTPILVPSSVYHIKDSHFATERYFSLKYDNQSTITVFIDQPNPGTRYAVNFKNIYYTGHSFVRIQYFEPDTSGNNTIKKIIYRGFYPVAQVSANSVFHLDDVDSSIATEDTPIVPEWDHQWSVAKVYTVTNERAKMVIDYINAFSSTNPKFNVQNNNCTCFVINVLKRAGIKPDIKKHIMQFSSEQKALAYQLGYSPTNSNFKENKSCYSAGDAGEDLRLADSFLTPSKKGPVENINIKIPQNIVANYKYITKTDIKLRPYIKSCLVSYMFKNHLKIKAGTYSINKQMKFDDILNVLSFENN